MEAEKLQSILAAHTSYLQDESTGQRANLRGANLRGANLREADLVEADLVEADLVEANLRGADLVEANLRGADLTGANLRGADLTRADLTGADLTRADLTRADLTRADLTRADLTRANLTGANLTGAMTWANLVEADLRGADLRGADLTRANLRGADLVEADLTWADLRGANLVATILQKLPTPWEWAQTHELNSRIIDGRTLCCAYRSRTSQFIGKQTYIPYTTYAAPYFSLCPTTACHPGLYIADSSWDVGPNPIWVAFWLDEAVIAGTPDSHKCRVRRFYVLYKQSDFAHVTATDLEVKP